MCILAELAADQFRTAQHIAPLVISPELHVAAIAEVELIEIIALHDHIIKFKETESLLHSLLVAFCPKHIVHGEVGADFPQKLNIIQTQKPLGIVHHEGLSIRKINEPAHLLLKALAVVLDHLRSHHLSHICTARGVSYHACAAADQSDGLIPRHLKALHQAKCHKVAHMEAVRRGIKSDIEHGFSLVHHLFDLFLIGHLGDQSPGH